MTPHAWLAFVGASIILLLIPGPTILMVIGDSMAHRGRSSCSTVAGVVVGDTTAMTLSLAGAGALLAASAAAFTILKSAGGLYLIYLGIQSIRKARTLGEPTLPVSLANRKTSLQRFLKAWTVTSLNPKGIIFFIAFVPQFMSAHSSFLAQSAILLPTFVLLAALNASMYALAAKLLAERLASVTARRGIGYAGGTVLIAAGTLTLGLQRT